MTRAPLALSVLLACVSIAAIANAAPTFDPSHKRIVIHNSIAGVKLGQSIKGAKRAWRGAGRCGGHGDATACLWGSERKGHLGFVYATGTDRVFQVSISAGISEHKNVYRKPLTTLKTSKGIGLGSKKSAVKRAYPGGRSINGPIDYCIRRGNTTTTFDFDPRRVAGITMYRGYGDQLATCD
jgi:hypothetical protein